MSTAKLAQEKINLAMVLKRTAPPGVSDELIRKAVNDLTRMAKTHHRYQEARCGSADFNAADERREEALEARITKLAASVGVQAVRFTGDPRGCTVKLLLPADENGCRPYNTWGGMESGWGVMIG